MLRSLLLLAAACGLVVSGESRTHAGPIIGGSALLSLSDQAQLENWLGEGGLTLNNIFTKNAGDGKTAEDFHTSADGQGRTFTVVKIQHTEQSVEIIGGYNPQSWRSDGTWNMTPNISDRTAFLFNLTSGAKKDQIQIDNESHTGSYQTYNRFNYGPTFGLGHDLFITTELDFGYNYSWSYGPESERGAYGTLLNNRSLDLFNVSSIEVFAIANDSVSPVPEPASMITLAAGAIGMLAFRMRKRKTDAGLAA